MATRLQGGFLSQNGTEWNVLIQDTNYSGTAVDITIAGDGFTLTHDGETDAVYSPIIGSSISVGLYNDSIGVDAFKGDLLNSQDKRFTIKIEKVVAGTPQLWWVGFIVQDLIEEMDEAKPRLIRLQAADGISLLSTVNYTNTLIGVFLKNIRDVLVDVLDNTGLAALFGANETMLTNVTNWWAEEQTYGAFTDPMRLTKFNVRVFNELRDNEVVFPNALEVIRAICVTFGARFYFANGSFRFEQISERRNTSVREFYYKPDGTSNGSANTSMELDVDQVAIARGGGAFRYLPAAKRAELKLLRQSAASLIGGKITYNSLYGDEQDLGIVPSADNGRLIFELLSRFQTTIVSPAAGTAVPVYAMEIRLEPSDGTADQYYTNAVQSGVTAFTAPSWSTTAGTYKWAANTVTRQQSTITNTPFNFVTAPLPKSGEVFFDVTILGFYIQGSSTAFFVGGNSFNWNVDVLRIAYENDNEPGNVEEVTHTATNSSTTIGSNIVVEVGETPLGDGAGAAGSLYANDGTDWVPSTGWREGNTGAYTDLASLCVQKILSLQSKVVHRFEGTLYSGGTVVNLFTFDGYNWLPLRATFNANADALQVELVRMNYDDNSVVVDDPTNGDTNATFAVTDSTGGYVHASSGSVTLDKVTTEVLTATGPSTLQATSMTNMLHTGNQIENITDVENSDGSVYNVTDSDFMIFNTWRGGNGVATINLPAATDYEGRLLRFKSDGTISNSTSINLVAVTGETIDGNPEVGFNRDYDGIMILAHGGNWFIIQRKSK